MSREDKVRFLSRKYYPWKEPAVYNKFYAIYASYVCWCDIATGLRKNEAEFHIRKIATSDRKKITAFSSCRFSLALSSFPHSVLPGLVAGASGMLISPGGESNLSRFSRASAASYVGARSTEATKENDSGRGKSGIWEKENAVFR